MAEYIEREAAIEFARLHYCKDCNNYNGIACRACAFDDAMLLIEDVPTADVVEVRHGYWKDNRNGTFTCSVCGGNSSKMDWCGRCGAKMDGKGDNK